MPNNWKKYKLGNIVELNYGKSLTATTRIPGNVPVFSSAGITGSHNKALVNSEAIIVGRKGSIGTVYLTKVPFYCIDTAYYILPNEKYDLIYLYYLLQSLGLDKLNSDSAVPGLNRDEAYSQEINLPPLLEQQAIAEILSSLDDKIELNLQTNKTLEEMANALYKHWFVDFGPFQNGKFIESELGLIPEGWEVKKIGEIFKTTSGGTPSRAKMEYYEDGNIRWVKSKELNGTFIIDTEEKITDEALKNSSAKLFPPKSVLLAMYGATVGEVGIVSKEATCNQAICCILPNEISYTYIFQYLKNNKQNILNNAVGSAQQNISQEIIKEFPIILPYGNEIKSVFNHIESFFEQIELNVIENISLKQTRDYLLPKLISGEIRVKDAVKLSKSVL